MRAMLLPCLLSLATGCVHTVQVELPAAPAVALDSPRVAVAAASRECRDVADHLVEALKDNGVAVDPHAAVSLEVSDCEGAVLPPEVEVQLAPDVDRRRVRLEGRAHAVVTVKTDGAPEAWLVGAGSTQLQGSWGEYDVTAMSRSLSRELDVAVARDLAEQVRPIPKQVERRVYARAAEGTPEHLYNEAVDAERDGRLLDARRLAQASLAERPSRRVADYLAELDRRIERLGATPSTASADK